MITFDFFRECHLFFGKLIQYSFFIKHKLSLFRQDSCETVLFFLTNADTGDFKFPVSLSILDSCL